MDDRMDDQDRKPGRPAAGGKPDATRDAPKAKERDRTLTEKAEEDSGGANRKTPGPVYDV